MKQTFNSSGNPSLPHREGGGGLCYILLISLFTLVACTESFSDRCRREAREFTERQCPRLVDQFMILDSMTYADEPQGFTYHYRLTGELDNPLKLSPQVLTQFTEQMQQGLRQDISLRRYKERSLTFTYRYRSERTDSLLFEASFGPEEYK